MSGAVPSVQLMRRADGVALSSHMTAEKRARFFQRLEETGNISDACDAIAISRNSAYTLRANDPEFDAQIVETMERVTDRLEKSIRLRAERGTRKGVWYKGEKVGTEREHHDILAMFMLKAARPDQYRENQGTTVNVGLSVESTAKLSDQQLELIVAQQMRQDRCLDANTFNVIRQDEKDSRQLIESTEQATHAKHSDVVQRSVVQTDLPKGPKRSRRGGGGRDASRQGDPKEEHGKARPLKILRRKRR